MTKKALGFALVFAATVFVAAPLGAAGLEFELNGVRFNNVLLGVLPVPTGADLEFHIPLSGGLLFSLRAAGGYEDRLILRDDVTGAPVVQPASFAAGTQTTWFDWPNAELDSGLIFRFPGLAAAGVKAEVFGLARGRWESNSPGLSTARFPDAQGLLTLSLLGGVGVDAVVKEPSRMMTGWAGEASFETSPSFLALSGGTDFSRFSAFLEGYLPLYSSDIDDLKAFSLYGAAYLTGDYAMGSKIPLYVLTGFGGRKLRDGLGDSIRGYQSWGYEAAMKAEASFDLRLVGPSLFRVPGLRPIAYLFGDAGWFGGLYDCTVADKNGLIFSAGGGAALDILDFAYLGLRAGCKFPVDDPLYFSYFPDLEKFFWGITFLLHF
ncbi:MAG: hypothetical protein NT061_03515 [Spirochaetes bacterium]|nr:hypothetical protein [Spirochaetota bacterium]